jgi:hypothetical protein
MSYKTAKNFLDAGRLVCFSGTPCQIEGLNKFLGKNYKNLMKVDFVCHAVVSPMVFKKYVNYMKDKYNKMPEKISFRDKKHYGYQYSQMAFYNAESECYYHGGIANDYYLRAFFSNICDRPSCYECSFKKKYRESDFTIWDCFDTDSFSEEFDNNGTTKMLLHSDKAKAIFEEIKEKFKYEQVDSEVIVKGVHELTSSVDTNSRRGEFFSDAMVLNDEELFKKHFPIKFRNKIEHIIRIAGAKTGMSSAIKKLGKRVLKNYTRN